VQLDPTQTEQVEVPQQNPASGAHNTVDVDVGNQLAIERSDASDHVILTATGEIDLASAPLLESEINASLDSGVGLLVIDLIGVTFLDSTGLRSLLATHTKLEEAGSKLALVVTGGPVMRLFDVTGIESALNIYPSVAAATA
jgi:anti-sigma B factor antagonist